MKSRIILLITAAMLMLTTPAWSIVDRACNPEFDAVGCDATNALAVGNFMQFFPIRYFLGQKRDLNGDRSSLNRMSDFTTELITYNAGTLDQFTEAMEYFTPEDNGQYITSPCFWNPHPAEDFFLGTVRATPESVVTFEWAIVLQMEPESDINVSIYDCIMQATGRNLFTDVGQTGRFYDESFIKFLRVDNPTMTVEAWPGKNSDFEPFKLDARELPSLNLESMDEQYYTSKANWEESIVCVRPENGYCNKQGDTTYKLRQGDRIKVTVQTQPTNRNDVYYGPDSVMLKYIGYNGSFYYNDNVASCDNREVFKTLSAPVEGDYPL